MMTLTTVSKKTSNNSALVFWRVGTKRKGILDVHIDFDHEEADLLAELVAIRYLALDKQVFCREPGAGAGYKLVVSKGAIKKLGHCCKVSDEAAFCLIQRPYISKTLLTRRISPRGSP
ncbi:hypothetical protein APC35_17295 [Acinetobacter baumannii]|nr:hypothetical protein APC35_17295 [Acinetobacter baumannii]KQG30337.1 hypothetical protein APC36_07500 [Acinetobacter baumannii]